MVSDLGFDAQSIRRLRLEFRDVVENASPYTLSGDFGEEPLDEVEPGAGRKYTVASP